jgi:predicted N-formylglutamate amidohydrolase
VHSFTPVLDGRVRDVDVGFLYDPSRTPERDFVTAWIAALRERDPTLRLRRNQPYRGTSDGLTTSLRQRFDATRYLGIELEISQAFPHGDPARWRHLRHTLTRTFPTA